MQCTTMQRFLMVLTKRSKTMQYVGCKTENRVRANKKHVRDANAIGISPRTANPIIINTPPRALSSFSTPPFQSKPPTITRWLQTTFSLMHFCNTFYYYYLKFIKNYKIIYQVKNKTHKKITRFIINLNHKYNVFKKMWCNVFRGQN